VIRAFGDAALLIELGNPDRAQALAAALRTDPIDGVTGLVPGLETLLVELDPLAVDAREVADTLEERIPRLATSAPRGRVRIVPVVYGGDFGRDIADVAGLCGMSEAEVVERHAAAELRVLFDGFAPGFAYLGGLPPELEVPRLGTPRTRTPAGSVAIAGSMSGIYPAELPGGWRVIGRTPALLFDAHRDPPAYLVPGDSVRFAPIDPAEWEANAGAQDDWA
jgi:KipI family sensor histidine kinase inhibitor